MAGSDCPQQERVQCLLLIADWEPCTDHLSGRNAQVSSVGNYGNDSKYCRFIFISLHSCHLWLFFS